MAQDELRAELQKGALDPAHEPMRFGNTEGLSILEKLYEARCHPTRQSSRCDSLGNPHNATSSVSFDNSDGFTDSRDYYIVQFPALISISCLLTRSAGSDANPTPNSCGGLHSSFSSWCSNLPSQSSAGILRVQVPARSHQLGSWGFKSLRSH